MIALKALEHLAETVPELHEPLTLLKRELAVYDKVRIALMSAKPEQSGHYFICGESGQKDKNNLPQYIDICPSYGADFSVRYQKTTFEETCEW